MESLPWNKVCSIFTMYDDYAVFVLDVRDYADAGAKFMVDLRAACREQGFTQKDPNFLLRNFGDVCFCGRDRVMYIFEQVASNEIGEGMWGSGRLPGIYMLNLSEIPKIDKLVIDKNDLLPCSYLNSPKMQPEAVHCLDGILVFSTEITYADESNVNNDAASVSSDFELYIANCCTSVRLPRLCVVRRGERRIKVDRRPLLLSGVVGPFMTPWVRQTCQYVLIMVDGQEQVLTPRYENYTVDKELARTSFRITAFAVISGETLVVQTDIGVLFSLNVALAPLQWQVFEGSALPYFHHNFVTKGNDVVLSPVSASSFSCDDSGDTATADVPFPLCSCVPPKPFWRNFAIGLPDQCHHPLYAPCILKLGCDFFDQNYWTLDVLIINVSNFNYENENENENENEKVEVEVGVGDGDEDEKEFGDEFVRRIKSLKFESGFCGSDLNVVCLYPF